MVLLILPFTSLKLILSSSRRQETFKKILEYSEKIKNFVSGFSALRLRIISFSLSSFVGIYFSVCYNRHIAIGDSVSTMGTFIRL